MKENKEEKLFWLDDPKMWRNIRGAALGVVLLISPLAYFGIMDNFELGNFLNYEFGGLIIFMTLMNLLSVFETRHRAFEDELDFDNTIIEKEFQIDDNAKKIRPHITKGMKVLTAHNQVLQESYNIQKTNLIIDKKKAKQDAYRIKIVYTRFNKLKQYYAWRLKKIDERINKLQKIPKRDRRFKPYRFQRLLTAENIGKYKRVGDKEVKSNPKKIPVVGAILKMPVKGFTMSLGGMFIMLFVVDNPLELFKFYVWFIVIIGFTIISQYIITRYKTRTQYRKSLDIKLHLQDIVIEGIEQQDKLIEEQEQIDSIEIDFSAPFDKSLDDFIPKKKALN